MNELFKLSVMKTLRSFSCDNSLVGKFSSTPCKQTTQNHKRTFANTHKKCRMTSNILRSCDGRAFVCVLACLRVRGHFWVITAEELAGSYLKLDLGRSSILRETQWFCFHTVSEHFGTAEELAGRYLKLHLGRSSILRDT